MLKKYCVIACVLASSALLILSPAHAHGDHKAQPPAKSATPANENIYASDSATTPSPETDLPLSQTDVILDEPHEKMEKGHDAHAGHKMPQVKISTHEWVPTSQKGYGAALGITILAGLVFGALSLIRPNE